MCGEIKIRSKKRKKYLIFLLSTCKVYNLFHYHIACIQQFLTNGFKDDLGADSLDLYELIMALEEEYDVEIPTDDLESINTVGDVINFLKSKGVE